jgi:hypothetical protein
VAGARETRWLTPRLRIGVAVALGALALAAMASAGGVGVIKQGTKAAVHVIKRTTHKSAPRRVQASAAGGQYQQHCGGVDPPEIACRITIYDASVKEGNTGITLMTFTVSLDAIPDSPVHVNYTTVNDGTPTTVGGTACPGFDYIIQSGPLDFPIGVSSLTITVQVCGDTVPEPDETFHIDLYGNSTNSTIYRGRATGTIVNDDH